MISSKKKIYGLIGFPLGHSFSQTYFNRKFEAENIDAEYVNFEISDIKQLMDVFSENPDLCGLNVTIPYKEQVIAYLDEIDPQAERIGAVNVIKIEYKKEGGFRLKGYNSDILGFSDSIFPLLTQNRKKALVLGTGGASKAVSVGLWNMGIEPTLVSRTKREGVLSYDELTEELIVENKIIVNTTPLGMYPNVDKCPDIPYEYLTPEHLCYDLLYNPDVTLFMRKAAEHGAETKNGLEMLLLQAFASWNIWNSK